MKVHFAASASQILKSKDLYSEICNIIVDEGNILVNNWIAHAVKEAETGVKNYSREKRFLDIIHSVKKTDVVIVEGTIESFSVGYQINLATQQEKPLLFLYQNGNNDSPSMQEGFDALFKSSHIVVAKYKPDKLKFILKNFFKLYEDGGKFRFNMFLDKFTRTYLNWIRDKSGTNKSDFIRDLIIKDSRKNKEYIEYLNSLGFDA